MKTNICINGDVYKIPNEVDMYIEDLKHTIHALKCDNRELSHKVYSLTDEMTAIKPIVEHKDYKPAMSSDCRECRYVVRSKYGGSILGCRKDNVCADFMPED